MAKIAIASQGGLADPIKPTTTSWAEKEEEEVAWSGAFEVEALM